MNPTPIVAQQRAVAGPPVTLSATLTDADGEPSTPAGPVTVKVERADGTSVLAAGTSTTAGTEPGVVARALTAAQSATLDVLRATWTDAATGTAVRTWHELAGAVYFTVADARTGDGAIAGGYSAAAIQAARSAVETEFETITGCAFVPRYRLARVDGNGTRRLQLPDPLLRAVRSVRIYDALGGFADWSAGDVTACRVDESGGIFAGDGQVFSAGRANVLVGYEHGHDVPPAEIRRYAIKRARQVLTEAASAIPSRATSFQVGDTGVFRLATAGRYSVGDPDIDGALARHTWRVPGIA